MLIRSTIIGWLLFVCCLFTIVSSLLLRPLNVVVVDIAIEDVENELLELAESFTSTLNEQWKELTRDEKFCESLKESVIQSGIPTLLIIHGSTCVYSFNQFPSRVVLLALQKRDSLYGYNSDFAKAFNYMDSLPDFQPKSFVDYDEDLSKTSSISVPWWMFLSLVLTLFVGFVIVGVFCYDRYNRRLAEQQRKAEKKLSSASSRVETPRKGRTSVEVVNETSKKQTLSSEKSTKTNLSTKSNKSSTSDKTLLNSGCRCPSKKEKNSKKSSAETSSKKNSKEDPKESSKESLKEVVKEDLKESKEECPKEESTETSNTTKTVGTKKPLELAKKTYGEKFPMSGSEMEAVLRSDRVDKDKTEIPEPSKRSVNSKIQEPITSTEFMYYMNKLGKICTDYVEDSSQYPVTCSGEPGFIYKRLSRQAPQEPDNFDSLCYDLKNIIMEGMTHWQHPRWHGYFPAGRNYAIMLAEVLITGLGVVGFSWESCPAMTEMEQAIINWMGNALGLPEHLMFSEGVLPEESIGGGCILESSSDAVHNVLIAARMAKIKETLNNNSVDKTKVRNNFDMEEMHELAKRFVVYTSKEAHSCIEKGSKVAMLRCRSVKGNPQNHYVLTGDVLMKEMQKDIERGYIPIYIHATLGTTNQAQSDDILSIWPIAHSHNMWLHVDAAYAAAAWIVPKYRSNRKGLEHISSLSFSAHKMMQHTAGQCFLFVKDQKVYKNAFAMSPVYLKTENKSSSDLRDWSVSLSHRFMCIRTWFLMRLYGLKGLQAYIERLCEMAVYFESLVAAHPNCRMYGKRVFTLFTFQYAKPGMTPQQVNETTTLLCKFMNKSHRIYFSDTNIHGTDVIRVCVNMERVTKAHIDESWSTMQDLMTEFETDIRRYGDISLSQSIQHVAHVRGSENEHTDRTEKSADDKSSRSSSISKELQKQGFTSITPTTVSSPQNDKATTVPSTPTTTTEKSTKSTIDETTRNEAKKSDKKEDKQA